MGSVVEEREREREREREKRNLKWRGHLIRMNNERKNKTDI